MSRRGAARLMSRHGAARLIGRRGAVAAVVLLGLACGGASGLDHDALERRLPDQIVPGHPDLLTEVTCPERIEKRAGAVVECTASLAGSPAVVRVTQLDDRGAVRAELDLTVLDVARSVAVLAQRFTTDLGITTTIECSGPAVRKLVVGEVLQCTARDPSLRSRQLAVTVIDEQGTLAATLG